MNTPEMRRQMAEGTSAEHNVILRAVHMLEAAVASPAGGREEAWAKRVARDLKPVAAAVAEHCRAAEGPGGLVQEMEVVLGRNHVLTKVSEEHNRLAAESEDILAALAADPVVAAIRARVANLTADLRAHQAHESDLIYEVFVRDIGVGD